MRLLLERRYGLGDSLLKRVLFCPLSLAAVGTLDSTELVEVTLTKLDEVLGAVATGSGSLSLSSVIVGLGLLVIVLVVRLGILDVVTAVVGASSLLTPTKRPAVATSRHRQRHSSPLGQEGLGRSMVTLSRVFPGRRTVETRGKGACEATTCYGQGRMTLYPRRGGIIRQASQARTVL
jgi:hypothetical protein